MAGKNELVNIENAPVDSSTPELNSIEKQLNNFLYSNPLKNTSIEDHVPFTVKQRELQHAVKKTKDTMARESSLSGQVEELIMVDTIQRLGLEHYFRKEIHAILERHFVKWCDSEESGSVCLHEVALCFRLLRQEGFNVTSDAFTKFKDKDGSFTQELSRDIKGLLNLFEASHVGIQGDDILDEARDFSVQLLKMSLRNAKEPEATIIETALGNPYLRSSSRLMAKNFLNNLKPSLKLFHDYEDIHAWADEIQDLSRMDLHIAQITHQNEITQVHRWWKELNLTKELKLARDHPVKWHIWSIAALPHPTLKEERIELTKPISFIYLIDDIFDLYGTLEELTLFTEAVNRWEYADMEGLPIYMKMCLKALQDTTRETSQKIYNKHGWNPETCFKKAWADLCNAFLVEARWFASGFLPCTEEYLRNGLVSSGIPVIVMHIFYLLGQGLNSKSIEYMNNFPDIASSMATILRLLDDLGTSKDENQEGHDGSYIECYKNEFKDSSAERAEGNLRVLVSEAWKRLNKMRLSPSPFLVDFVAACLNGARLVPMMYSYDHNHHLPSLEKHMKSFLYESLYWSRVLNTHFE